MLRIRRWCVLRHVAYGGCFSFHLCAIEQRRTWKKKGRFFNFRYNGPSPTDCRLYVSLTALSARENSLDERQCSFTLLQPKSSTNRATRGRKPKAKKQRITGPTRYKFLTDMGAVHVQGLCEGEEAGRETFPQKIRAQMLRVWGQ